MAVAHKQTEEILKVLMNYLSQENIVSLLEDLQRTEAYKKNRSFHDTINRLQDLTR